MRPTRMAVVVFSLGFLLAGLPVVLAPGLWTYWLAFVFLAAGLMGADVILRPPLRRLDIQLRAPDRLFVGAGQEVDLVLVNPTRRRFQLRIKVDADGELDEIGEQRKVRIGPGVNRVKIRLLALRRGQAELPRVWMEAAGPLGLTICQKKRELEVRLPVIPNLEAVSEQAIQLFSTRSQRIGVQVERYTGDGSEFDHLREYVPGFDIRTIDWKASARHAKLLCRYLRAERNRQVLVAVDAGRLMSEPVDGVTKLDHAIHAGLVLAYVSLQVGDRVGLASFDDRLRHFHTPVHGREAFGRLSRVATRIAYSRNETNFTLGLMELARRQVRRSLVVVITDFVDTITAELMMENLSRLSRRHMVVFVALQDAQLEREAEKRPERILDLHRTVVAHRLLSERELVIRKLRRLGIMCVDAPPRRVSAQLVARYLEVKRKEAF